MNVDQTTDNPEAIADMIRALGHPSRLEIIRVLSRARSEVSVIKLVLHTRQPQSTISGHLKALKRVGLVYQPRPRLRSGYLIVPAALKGLKTTVRNL